MANYKTSFTVDFEGEVQGSEFVWTSLEQAKEEFRSVMDWYEDTVLSFTLERIED